LPLLILFAIFVAIAEGGGLAAFEKHIGPVENVEKQWYGYLAELQRLTGPATPPVRVLREDHLWSRLISED